MSRPIINHKKCNLCGLCVALCCGLVIGEQSGRVVVFENECNECTECADECPPGAITMKV